MQISITNIKTAPQTITITKAEYNALKKASDKYTRLQRTASQNLTRTQAKLTPEERRQKAQKAAKARWNQKDI